MTAIPSDYIMDLFSNLPGNGKGALGAPSDNEGGFNVTAL